MIEALLVLTIFLCISAFFPLLFQSIYKADQMIDPQKAAEWEIFIVQLRKELHQSSAWNAGGEKLLYEYAGETVMIEKYDQFIRRRVAGKGHEIMLQHTKTVHFSWQGKVLVVKMEFLNGERKEAKFSPLYGRTGDENE